MSIGKEIEAELAKAREKHAPMNSAHEGYAVILEELDELWDEIKKQKPDPAKCRKEAIQVGAMAARFVVDVVERMKPVDLMVCDEPHCGKGLPCPIHDSSDSRRTE